MKDKPTGEELDVVNKILTQTRQKTSGDPDVQKIVKKVVELSSKGQSKDEIASEIVDDLRNAAAGGKIINRLDIYV